jgi:putative glutathione S-transferase
MRNKLRRDNFLRDKSIMNKNLSTFTSIRHDRQLHLYLAWGCPFCHRILAALAITKLEDNISITWMENIKGEAGWKMYFLDEPLFNSDSLKAVYQQLEPTVEHRYSVPLLVDKKNNILLSTSSSEIVRYITKGFDGTFSVAYDLLPNKFIKDIDEMNQWLHDKINRAVYLVGFATQQPDYEEKLNELFKALDELVYHVLLK